MDFASARYGQAFPVRPHRAARWGLVFLALLYGWIAVVNAMSASHDPYNLQRSNSSLHAGLTDAPAADSGHTHDEGDFGEDPAAHQHGHNPSDHSHDKPNLPRSGPRFATASAEVWESRLQLTPYPTPYFAFERPPKPLPQH